MATNYPGSLDTSTQQPSPSASTEMDDSGFEHDVVHANHSGAIIAVETKVGTGASTPVANSVLGGTGSGTSAWTTTPTLGGLTVNSGGTNNVATFESTDAGALISLKDDTTTGTAYVGLRADGDILKLRSNNTNQVTISANGNATFLGKLLAPDGSASTPAFSFSGDPNTGMLRSGNDELGLATGGTQRLTIKQSGNVGIGTTSPANPLHVNGGTANFVARLESTDGEAYLGLQDSASSSAGHVAVGAIGDDLVFRAGNNNAARLKSNGDLEVDTDTLFVDVSQDRVGVNRNSPVFPLHAFGLTVDSVVGVESGDEGAYIAFVDSTSTGNVYDRRIGVTGDSLKFQTSATDRMTILSGGAVGIGTNSPGRILEVADNVPAIRLTDDNNAGVYHEILGDGASLSIEADDNNQASSSSINFKVDGTEYARLNSDGFLGIGSAFPGRPLEIKHNFPAIRLKDTSTSDEIFHDFLGDGDGLSIRADANGDATSPFINFQIGGSQKAVITNDGRLGIGTTSPAHPLDVVGEARFSSSVQFNNGGQVIRNWGSGAIDNLLPGSTFGGILEGNSSGHFVIGIRDNDADDSFSVISGGGDQTTNGYDTVVAYFGANGEVGIGTSSPAATLHVAGNMQVGTSSTDYKMSLYRQDTGTADHINIYNGSTLVGTIGAEDNTWLRLNQEVAKNIYTPRLLRADGGFQAGNGSTSAPAYSFQADSNTGFYVTGNGGVIRFVGNGTPGGWLSSTGIRTVDGSAATPSHSFTSDSNTGMYRSGTDELAFTTSGSQRVKITAGGTLIWINSSGIGGPLTDTSSTSGFRYVLQNQTFGTLQDFSSIRDRKEQITNVTTADSARWIDALQPVTYIERWFGEGEEPADNKQWREADMQVGFIADDVLASTDTSHFAQATDNGEGGLDPSGWKWETVIAAAVAEIKSLRTRVAVLENA